MHFRIYLFFANLRSKLANWYKNKFETINRGIPGGYPSLELPDIMGRYIKKYNPHIVILMLRFHEYQWRYTDVSISNLSESINEKFWIMVIESENI